MKQLVSDLSGFKQLLRGGFNTALANTLLKSSNNCSVIVERDREKGDLILIIFT